MKLYPSWRINLLVFAVIIVLVIGYFFRQTHHTFLEFQKRTRTHSKMLAAVVELNIRNAMLSKSGLEDIVASSLENSARFIHYLDSIEPFSSVELTAFAQESGLAGVRIVHADSGSTVSGPADWLSGRGCRGEGELQHLPEEQLYLFTYFPVTDRSAAFQHCVLVGLSAEKIDEILDNISVERLLAMFNEVPEVAYIRFEPSTSSQVARTPDRRAAGDSMETIVSIGDRQLVVALKTDRLSRRLEQIENEFIIFIGLLVLFGLFSTWWLYRVQQQRLQQAREFERKMARQHEDAALGRAAATITHELRNPLNAIGMGLQRLQMEAGDLDREQQGLLVSMRNAVDRADTIITRLKQSIHTVDMTSQPVDLTDLLSQLLTLYRAQCKQLHIDLEFNREHNIVVAGDHVLLGQLFDNLLKNSIEAQPDGGFVKVSIRSQENSCCVEIINGGFSLSREESKLLFEPYFTTKSKGTGLGLVISEKIVQAHNGQLDRHVDSGDRTISFSVTLPMER